MSDVFNHKVINEQLDTLEQYLVTFGNYLLSQTRRDRYISSNVSSFDELTLEERLSTVNQEDLGYFYETVRQPNEDAVATRIAVSKADDMVRNYKQYGDNNWNITI